MGKKYEYNGKLLTGTQYKKRVINDYSKKLKELYQYDREKFEDIYNVITARGRGYTQLLEKDGEKVIASKIRGRFIRSNTSIKDLQQITEQLDTYGIDVKEMKKRDRIEWKKYKKSTGSDITLSNYKDLRGTINKAMSDIWTRYDSKSAYTVQTEVNFYGDNVNAAMNYIESWVSGGEGTTKKGMVPMNMSNLRRIGF